LALSVEGFNLFGPLCEYQIGSEAFDELMVADSKQALDKHERLPRGLSNLTKVARRAIIC
jgi:hypothetical protein